MNRADLFEKARTARRSAAASVARAEATRAKLTMQLERVEALERRTQAIRERWLSSRRERLRYSESARMAAQLESMPVIEQAKGILMGQCGWTADQAFDALRRASQRSNVRVRDIAAAIAGRTTQAQSALPKGQSPPRLADPAVVAKLQKRSHRRGSAPPRPVHPPADLRRRPPAS